MPHAKQVAQKAHQGQMDRSGEPYIGHPQRVAATLTRRGLPDEIVAAGWLHDVVEDSDTSLQDLLDDGFPPSVVEAVDALSHYPNESLEEYIQKVRNNPMAIPVKLADLADNSDPNRLEKLSKETQERLIRKYARSHELLGQ